MEHYILAQNNLRLRGNFHSATLEVSYTHEKFDYCTIYFKGHTSQNDDNPAVKHKYMDVLLEVKG